MDVHDGTKYCYNKYCCICYTPVKAVKLQDFRDLNAEIRSEWSQIHCQDLFEAKECFSSSLSSQCM